MNRRFFSLPNFFLLWFYAAVSLLAVVAHNRSEADRRLRLSEHEIILSGSAGYLDRYRIFSPVLAQSLSGLLPQSAQGRLARFWSNDPRFPLKVWGPIHAAYASMEFVSLWIAAIATHLFLGLFLGRSLSLLGVCLLFLSLPGAYLGTRVWDIPNLAFFTVGLYWILKKRDAWLCFWIPLAMLNRETSVFLVLANLLCRWEERKNARFLATLTLQAALAFGAWVLLVASLGSAQPIFTREVPSVMGHAFFNNLYHLTVPNIWAKWLATAHVLLPLSVIQWRKKSPLTKRLLLTAACVWGINLLYTYIGEIGAFLYTFPILILASLETLDRSWRD
ncbi:MAG: hypothetical protein HY402_03380 [Elusimicrobia bacterium]|nr:hypothetical protein [Elusimicrobiota bacterium]